MDRYVEVLLPLPLEATFTYRLLPEMGDVAMGQRIVVPFGSKKFYTGLVVGFPLQPPEGLDTKDAAMLLDDAPIVRHPQTKLWRWIADYYLCAEGDVYKAAVPAGLKLESETFVEINPDFDITADPLDDGRQVLVYQMVEHEGSMTVAAIAAKAEFRGTAALVNRMIDSGVLVVSEKLVERYRVKQVPYVAFNVAPDQLPEAFEAVKGARKQEALLLAMLEMTGYQRGGSREVKRELLLERSGVSAGILNAVVAKGVLKIIKKEESRFRYDGEASGVLPQLTCAQADALDKIHLSWKERDVTLLHGVTSSGKTELYIHLIDYVLRRGEQVLYLVPEIALTTQLTRRLQQVFGSKVVIYHSRFSDNERVDIWKKLLTSHEPLVVIGARSATFLPFAKLGLVIVDEEHESSYKQFDPAPRYNGRDVAIVLASMHGAKTLLGSATPSIETYYKALQGKFGLVELMQRYGNVTLPAIEVADMKREWKAKSAVGNFSSLTITSVREALGHGAQAILFQNRRGYAPMARCKQCAWVPRCRNCDVALTYHSHLRQLQCHYCGAVYPLPNVCPQCHEPAIEIIGYGTERVEEDVQRCFPDVKMLRMDLDTTRNKDSYARIIDDFSARKAQILVGTQMVTKGLDFDGVEVVAVLSADSLINYPDFRSAERAFNMLEQVAGRAGRREGASGRVIVQTTQPDHPIIGFLLNHDFRGFYNHEIAERQRFFYPPFSRVVNVYLKHRDAARLRQIAQLYADALRAKLGSRVLGPEEPAISRINSLYIRKVMVKIETTASMPAVKQILRQCYIDLHQSPQAKGSVIYYDVDPM